MSLDSSGTLDASKAGSAGSSVQIIAWAYEDAPNAGQIEYITPYGATFNAATVRNFCPGRPGTLKKMTLLTNSSGHVGTTVVNCQISGVDSILEITLVNAASNTIYSDTDDVTFAATDTIRFKFDGTSHTSGTMRIASVVLEVIWD